MAPKKTAMTRQPSKLQRLSPGVYRGADGGLADRSGRPINQRFRPPTQSVTGGRPAGNPAGSFLDGITAGIGGAIGGGKMPMEPNKYGREPNVFIQPYPGVGRPDRQGPPNVFAQPYPGVNRGGQPQPNLDQIARERARAISEGGMVTMDYNPERERLVDQYLREMNPPRPAGGSFINDMMSEPGYSDSMGEQMQNAATGLVAPWSQEIQDREAATRGNPMSAGRVPFPRPVINGGYGDGLAAGVAAGVGAGLGGNMPTMAPGFRAPAPIRPRGDGRDRRFPQPAVRPPLPMDNQQRRPTPMDYQPYQPAVRPPAPMRQLPQTIEGIGGGFANMFRRG